MNSDSKLSVRDFLNNAAQYLEESHGNMNDYIREYGYRRLHIAHNVPTDYNKFVFKAFCHCLTMIESDNEK